MCTFFTVNFTVNAAMYSSSEVISQSFVKRFGASLTSIILLAIDELKL